MGNVVDKPMTDCTGEQIMKELLFHLDFLVEEILPKSITVLCFSPLATSAILPRHHMDRPQFIPPNTA
jgi:oleate hydratase